MQREKDTKDVKYQKSNYCLKMIDWLKIKKLQWKTSFSNVFFIGGGHLWTENDFSKATDTKKRK